MKSIIEQFYWGEINPCEFPAPNDAKYKKTVSELSRTESEFIKNNPDIAQDIAEYRDILQTMAACEGANDFVNGFRLGALFILDTLKNTY